MREQNIELKRWISCREILVCYKSVGFHFAKCRILLVMWQFNTIYDVNVLLLRGMKAGWYKDYDNDAENDDDVRLLIEMMKSSLYQHLLRLNTFRPRPNCRRFADYIFKRILLNDYYYMLILIWLKYVLRAPAFNMPALVQIMLWRRTGDKPLSEPKLA